MIKIDPRDKGPMKKNVGRRLMEVRETFNLNQQEFGARLGMNGSQSLISMYENGGRMLPPDVAAKVAETFQVTLDWLYLGEAGSLNPAVWQMLRDTRARLDAQAATKLIKAPKRRSER